MAVFPDMVRGAMVGTAAGGVKPGRGRFRRVPKDAARRGAKAREGSMAALRRGAAASRPCRIRFSATIAVQRSRFQMPNVLLIFCAMHAAST